MAILLAVGIVIAGIAVYMIIDNKLKKLDHRVFELEGRINDIDGELHHK